MEQVCQQRNSDEVLNKKAMGYNGEVENMRTADARDSNISGEILRDDVSNSPRLRQEHGKSLSSSIDNFAQPSRSDENNDSKVVATICHELDERRRKKREAAKREVMRRLEKLTIGGEARGNDEVRKRRERRRKRLEILAQALEKSSQDGNGSAFEVYGQLRSTEDALKRMAKKAKQLESEVADLQVIFSIYFPHYFAYSFKNLLNVENCENIQFRWKRIHDKDQTSFFVHDLETWIQASWDAERRDLLRRELLATQLCEAMIPHLKPGCPFRDLESVRSSATWCDELGRWRLLDASSSSRIPMPPPLPRDPSIFAGHQKTDHNNNNGDSSKNEDRDFEDRSSDDDDYEDRYSIDNNGFNGGPANRRDIAGTYFRRNRIDELLAHAREAKTFGK